ARLGGARRGRRAARTPRRLFLPGTPPRSSRLASLVRRTAPLHAGVGPSTAAAIVSRSTWNATSGLDHPDHYLRSGLLLPFLVSDHAHRPSAGPYSAVGGGRLDHPYRGSRHAAPG